MGENSANVVWLLVSSALVFLMTPGLAFFYAGLVRRKNAVNTLMYSLVSAGVVTVVWVLWGYTLAFGSGGPFIGGFEFFGFANLDATDVGGGLPFAIFQLMFAIITPAIISGAVAERFKFTTYLIFLVLWVTVVYVPAARWVWSGTAWITDLGAKDFAGGTVVHLNAAIAAIAAVLLIGRRRGGTEKSWEPHHVPFVLLGAGLLWFGWFGFNAGSALAADGVAVNAFVVTQISAAVGMLAWAVLTYVTSKRFSSVGALTGAIAGLVAITPAAGNVDPLFAILIGAVAGVLTFYGARLIARLRFDDTLGVFAIHGIAAIWGGVATGIFNNDPGANNFAVLGANLLGMVVVGAYCFVLTFGILKLLDVIPGLGLRVKDSEEDLGLDLTQHGERAYVDDGAD